MKNLPRITSVKPLPTAILELQFADGLSGRVDLSTLLDGPLFSALRNPDLFNQVQLDSCGAIAWPNGADLDPLLLYEAAKSDNPDPAQAAKRLEARYTAQATV